MTENDSLRPKFDEAEHFQRGPLIGSAVCDLETGFHPQRSADQLSEDEYISAWEDLLGSAGTTETFEIQCEQNLNPDVWSRIRFKKPQFFGVHQPIKHKDVISDDPHHANWSVKQTLQGMDLAQQLGANYYVFHLNQNDRRENRDGQMERALGVYSLMADYYGKKGHTYDMLLEVPLEYPKLPSDEEEIVRTVQRARGILPKTGITIDVAHHWHNATALLPNAAVPADYPQALGGFLDRFTREFPKQPHVYHLGEAYIDHGTGIHETHGFPGVVRGQKPGENIVFHRPQNFNGPWMDFGSVITTLNDHAVKNNNQLRIILEIIGSTIHDRNRLTHAMQGHLGRQSQ